MVEKRIGCVVAFVMALCMTADAQDSLGVGETFDEQTLDSDGCGEFLHGM